MGKRFAGGAVPRPVIVGDTRYPSINAAARALRLYPATLARRLRDGWDLDEAIGAKPHHKSGHGLRFRYGGKTYPSVRALAIEIGIRPAALQARLAKGRSISEAVRFQPRRVGHPKPVTFRGATYASGHSLAAKHGMTWSVVSRRVGRGWTMEQALGIDPPPPRFRDFEGHARSQLWKKVQEIDGRQLPATEAGEYRLYVIRNKVTGREYVGITTSPLAARLRGHFALARKGRKSHLYNAMRRYGRGAFEIEQVRNDARDFAELQQQEVEAIARRDTIRNGYNTARGGSLGTSKEIRVGNLNFPSRGAAADHFGIDVTVFNLRLGRLGWTPEQAAEIEPRAKYARRKVKIGRTEYPSLKAAAESLGLRYSRVADRVISKGWSVRQALELDAPPSSVVYRGKPVRLRGKDFPSVAQAAVAHGVDPDALSDRLRHGDTPEQALRRCIAVRDGSADHRVKRVRV